MSAPRPWTVLPVDPILKHTDNLWSVRGEVRPGSPIDRRMAIVRLGDGRLVFYNAVPLPDAAMADVEAWGKPAFLVVPNGFHRLDIHAFKARYPGMLLLCPPGAAERVGKVAAVDGDTSRVPADPGLEIVLLDGTKHGEPVFVVTSGGQRSLVFGGDAVMNMAHGSGLAGFLFKLLGSTGGPRVTLIARLFVMSDRAKLKAQLEKLAALPDLVRILPSHGRIIDADAAATLRAVAAAL